MDDRVKDALRIAAKYDTGPKEGEATLKPYEPTLREKIYQLLAGTEKRPTAERANFARGVANMAEFAPGVGNVMGAQEAMRRGDNKGAALAMLPIPGVSAEARAAKAALEPAEEAAKKAIRAYHYSPTAFERFEPGHAGTGAGGTSFGHGTGYFGAKENDARMWQDRINAERGLPKGSGHMYEVELKADPERMIDYNKYLHEQSDFVKDALQNKLGIDNPSWFTKPKEGEFGGGKPRGDMAVPMSPGAMKAWRDAGIEGVKYYDPNNAYSGYVTFDEDPATILRRYADGGSIPLRLPYGQRYNPSTDRLDSPESKGIGFRGPLKRGDHIVSEYSADRDIQYPSIYEGISPRDLAAVMLAERINRSPPPDVDQRAYDAARRRVAQGRSPFFEQGKDKYPEWSPEQDWPEPAVMREEGGLIERKEWSPFSGLKIRPPAEKLSKEPDIRDYQLKRHAYEFEGGEEPTAPRRKVTLNAPALGGKKELGEVPYYFADPITSALNLAYGLKTAPLYSNPYTAPLGRAIDAYETAKKIEEKPEDVTSFAGVPKVLRGAGPLGLIGVGAGILATDEDDNREKRSYGGDVDFNDYCMKHAGEEGMADGGVVARALRIARDKGGKARQAEALAKEILRKQKPVPGSDEYWEERKAIYAKPYGERLNSPDDPRWHISPEEYKKGYMGRTEYVLANGGRAGYATGGEPTNLPTDNPVLEQPDPTRSYVQSLYHNIMGRSPEQGGLDYWTQQLNEGNISQAEVLQQFAKSNEFQNLYKQDPNKAVSALYQTALGRAPEQGGLDYWTQQAKQGLDLGQMVSGFTGSQEGENAQYINQLYQQYTGNVATPEQIQQAQRQLGPNQDWGSFIEKTFPTGIPTEETYQVASSDKGVDNTASNVSFNPQKSIVDVVEAGPGYTTIKYDDGTVEKRVGDFGWRQQNPGNVKYSSDPNWWGHQYGAIKGGKATDGGNFAVFPTLEQGNAAREHLLFDSPGYQNLTLQKAMYRYAPPKSNPHVNDYIAGMANAAGVSINTKMKDFTPEQRAAAMKSQVESEGNRQGKTIILAKGTGTTTPGPERDPIEAQTKQINDIYQKYNINPPADAAVNNFLKQLSEGKTDIKSIDNFVKTTMVPYNNYLKNFNEWKDAKAAREKFEAEYVGNEIRNGRKPFDPPANVGPQVPPMPQWDNSKLPEMTQKYQAYVPLVGGQSSTAGAAGQSQVSAGNGEGTTLAQQGAGGNAAVTTMVNPGGTQVGGAPVITGPYVDPNAAWGTQQMADQTLQGILDKNRQQQTDLFRQTQTQIGNYDPFTGQVGNTSWDPMTGVGIHSSGYQGPGQYGSVSDFNPGAATGYVPPTLPPGVFTFKQGGVVKPDDEDVENALRLARRKGGRINTKIDKDPDFDMSVSLASGGRSPAWTRKEGQNPEGGLNAKGRASAKAEGSNLKPPAPHPKTDEAAARRKSFCARMKGMKAKLTSSETANDPDSRINKSLRVWNCHDTGGVVRDALRVARGGEIWDKKRPKSLGEPEALSSSQKKSAKASAKAAGRPYPNLVDNMRAAQRKK